MKIENWIFVTGAPRSGTTFVGHTLSAPLQVDYIHEPFNPDCGISGINRRFLYLRPDGSDSAAVRESIGGLFRYDVKLSTGYYPEDSVLKKGVKAIVGSRGPFYLRLAKINPFHTAAVVKDPVGCLLTAYLAEQHRVRPVVMVRHPVAVAASVKRLGWKPDLEFLAGQPHLAEDYFQSDCWADADLSTPIRAAAWEWRALNTVLLAQAALHPDWLLIRHEDLSAEPVATFRTLYRELDLPWSDRLERDVLRRTRGSNPTEARRGRTQDFSRDSRGLLDLRLGMLTAEERREVFAITEDVALDLYPEESFRLESADGPGVDARWETGP